VLDEPTASIDAVTEEKIFNSLEQHMEGKTVVLITHKFSTVKNADRIVVLEHGQIVESGRHDDLIKKNGRYEELYSIQAKRYNE
jgi:ATP-binding cassette subfamily B protein